MGAAPRLALLCLIASRAFAGDTADIDFLNLQGDIRINKKETRNLERRVDDKTGDLARQLEAALTDRQAMKTQLSMLQAQVHSIQTELQALAERAAAAPASTPIAAEPDAAPKAAPPPKKKAPPPRKKKKAPPRR